MKSLIIVRAGDASLHSQYLRPSRNDRTYDVAISYYGNSPDFWKDKCDFFHYSPGGSKWPRIYEFIQTHENLITDYDFVWCVDDDIWMHYKDVERFLDICRENQFVIAQPSLMRGSFYSWDITLQKLYSKYRLTNFVEIMAPCFNTRFIHEFIGTFSLNSSGFGLEFIWWDIANKKGNPRFAIIDQVSMLHTREVGSAGTGGASGDPLEEMYQTLARLGVKEFEPQVLYQENAYKKISCFYKAFRNFARNVPESKFRY